MFKLDANRTFARDVIVMVPIDGGFREETLKTLYNYVDVETQDAFDFNDRKSTTAFLEMAVNRFDGVITDNDQPVPDSAELRRQLFGMHYVRVALIKTFLDAVTKVKVGN